MHCTHVRHAAKRVTARLQKDYVAISGNWPWRSSRGPRPSGNKKMTLLTSLFDYLRRERNYRKTCRSLHQLDDRILHDIGLRRDQINSVACELYEAERQYSAANAQNRRQDKARRGAMGASGLAHQH